MPARRPEPDDDFPTDLERRNADDGTEPPDDSGSDEVSTQQSRSSGDASGGFSDTSSGYSDLSGSMPAHPRGEDEDIYGEDDYPPEDESYQGPLEDEDSANSGMSQTRTGRKPVSNTRVSDEDLEDGAQPNDRTRAGPPYKLEIIAGPDEGKSKRFSGVRMVIGRVKGCEILLSDQSVSRKHLELVRGEKGVLLRDLASGNGTKVNAEKVTERLLQDGDEIAVGKTKIRFVDELAQFRRKKEEAERKELEALAQAAAAAEKVEAERRAAELAANPPPPGEPSAVSEAKPPPGRVKRLIARWRAIPRQVKVVGGIGAGLLAIIVLVLVWSTGTKDSRVVLAESQLASAKKALEADQPDVAIGFAQRARQISPGVDKEQLLELAQREVEAQTSIAKAEALLAQRRFAEARAELQKVKGVGEKRSKRVAELLGESDTRNDDYLYEKAKEALAMRELEVAQQIIGGLSPARNRELTARLMELRVRKDNEFKTQERVRKQVQETFQKRVEEERVVYEEQAFAGVARKFHAGDFKRATLECDRVAEEFSSDPTVQSKAKELKSLIPAFARSYEDGQRKFKAGALESSVRPLRRALEIYKQIGFSGALGTLIEEELASAALAAAKSAFNRSDYAAAATGYRETLKLAPTEERAKEGLARLAETAEELYSQAYGVRDSDPRLAVSKFRLVLEITSPSSSVYQKAKEQLASMQP